MNEKTINTTRGKFFLIEILLVTNVRIKSNKKSSTTKNNKSLLVNPIIYPAKIATRYESFDSTVKARKVSGNKKEEKNIGSLKVLIAL